MAIKSSRKYITILCTKKLLSELKVPVSNESPIASQAIYGWHAHLFICNRRKCVLVMNNVTRYNFVMYGLKKDDFIGFEDRFVDQLKQNLEADGIEPFLVDKYLGNQNSFNYATTSDRSILSQINEMIMIAKYEMERNISESGVPEVDQVNRFFNRFVFLKLPKLYSGETMRETLQNL